MLRDYYKILGVSPSARLAEIRAAYKKLALKYHPDRNPDDSIAEEHFKEINEAYQVLGNKEKRTTYNRIRSNPYQSPERPQHQHTHQQGRPAYQRPVTKVAPRKLKFLYLYIFGGFAILIFFLLRFFNFMEGMAANEFLAEAEKAYYEEGRYLRALDRLELALQKKPELARANFLYGKILASDLGNYEDARFYLDLALEYQEGPIGEHYLERGKVLEILGEHAGAISDLESAYALAPENVEVNLKLADLYLYHFMDHPQAEPLYAYVLSQEPDRFEALLGHGIALQELQRFDESFKKLQAAYRQNSTNGPVNYYLGTHYLIVEKDTSQACAFWEAASVYDTTLEAGPAIQQFCNGMP